MGWEVLMGRVGEMVGMGVRVVSVGVRLVRVVDGVGALMVLREEYDNNGNGMLIGVSVVRVVDGIGGWRY